MNTNKLSDGIYVVHHFCDQNPRHRLIAIEQGSVFCGGHWFSQPHFFEVNIISWKM